MLKLIYRFIEIVISQTPREKLLASEEKEFADAYRDMACSNRTIAKKLMDHVLL